MLKSHTHITISSVAYKFCDIFGLRTLFDLFIAA